MFPREGECGKNAQCPLATQSGHGQDDAGTTQQQLLRVVRSVASLSSPMKQSSWLLRRNPAIDHALEHVERHAAGVDYDVVEAPDVETRAWPPWHDPEAR